MPHTISNLAVGRVLSAENQRFQRPVIIVAVTHLAERKADQMNFALKAATDSS
jgi:hypothetical protein